MKMKMEVEVEVEVEETNGKLKSDAKLPLIARKHM